MNVRTLHVSTLYGIQKRTVPVDVGGQVSTGGAIKKKYRIQRSNKANPYFCADVMIEIGVPQRVINGSATNSSDDRRTIIDVFDKEEGRNDLNSFRVL